MGGSETSITEYPYLASVRYYGGHMCGGVFVSKRHVLTAAHCVYHENAYTKRGGTISPDDLSIASGSTSSIRVKYLHKVESIAVHPSYDGSPSGHLHDIAVVRVRKLFLLY